MIDYTIRDLRAIAKFQLNGKPQHRTMFWWTPDEDEILTSLRNQGFSFKECARALPSRSPEACMHRFHALTKGDEA